jgi:hypothetical protein
MTCFCPCSVTSFFMAFPIRPQLGLPRDLAHSLAASTMTAFTVSPVRDTPGANTTLMWLCGTARDGLSIHVTRCGSLSTHQGRHEAASVWAPQFPRDFGSGISSNGGTTNRACGDNRIPIIRGLAETSRTNQGRKPGPASRCARPVSSLLPCRLLGSRSTPCHRRSAPQSCGGDAEP